MIRMTLIAAMAAAGMATAAPVMAQQEFPDFETMDANRDGRVTKEEFMAALSDDQKRIGERVFAARDANNDGVLTREEFSPRG